MTEPPQFPAPEPIGPWATLFRQMLFIHAARIFGPLPDNPLDVNQWLGQCDKGHCYCDNPHQCPWPSRQGNNHAEP